MVVRRRRPRTLRPSFKLIRLIFYAIPVPTSPIRRFLHSVAWTTSLRPRRGRWKFVAPCRRGALPLSPRFSLNVTTLLGATWMRYSHQNVTLPLVPQPLPPRHANRPMTHPPSRGFMRASCRATRLATKPPDDATPPLTRSGARPSRYDDGVPRTTLKGRHAHD